MSGAIGIARRALELAPGDPDLHTSLGLMETARGEHAAALAAFDGALAVDRPRRPGSPHARTHLEASLAAVPDHTRAPQVRAILRQLGGG